ncbi:MAG: LysE family translocator [Chthoniobacterales bacterium]
MFLFFIKSFLIGLAVAAPVGPIGLLCIQRSLRSGFNIGFMTGLGAATADTLYGIIAAFGLTALSSLLILHQTLVHSVGALFLFGFGLKLIFTKHHADPEKASLDQSLWHAYGTTFFLTLMNPMTIFSFMAIFAALGLGTHHHHYFHASILVLGIFCGSAFWWLSLSSGVAYILHHRINDSSMILIDKFSGGLMMLFGIIALWY